MIVSVAATQMQCTWDVSQNLEKAENLIEKAAERGANIVLLQELFSTPYFCPEQKREYFSLANEVKGHPYLKKFSNLAKKLNVVLPISFFERRSVKFQITPIVFFLKKRSVKFQITPVCFFERCNLKFQITPISHPVLSC